MLYKYYHTVISIHPPLAGRDDGRLIEFRDSLFQSTRPLRGGTLHAVTKVKHHLISIHPPLAGRDSDLAQKKLCKTSHIAQKVHLPWPY